MSKPSKRHVAIEKRKNRALARARKAIKQKAIAAGVAERLLGRHRIITMDSGAAGTDSTGWPWGYNDEG